MASRKGLVKRLMMMGVMATGTAFAGFISATHEHAVAMAAVPSLKGLTYGVCAKQTAAPKEQALSFETEDSMPKHMADHQVDVHSSVQVSRDVLRDAFKASRDAYTQKLQRYAKCTPKDAEKSVRDAHPGMKIEAIQLRNIRTNLVYVSVVSDDQDKYLVIVDAGNAKVLMDRRLETHHERVFANHE